MNIKGLTGKTVFAYPVLALTLVLGACSEESVLESPKEVSKGQTATFKASPLVAETRAIGTKVVLTPPASALGNDMLSWENNDDVSFLFYSVNNNLNSTFTVGVEADNSATLTGDVPATAGIYSLSAISPMSESFFAGNQLGTATLTISQTQTQIGTTNTSHLKPYIYLYANANNAIDVEDENNWSGDVSLDFKVLPSFLRFDVDNWSEEAITLKQINISYPEGGSRTFYESYSLDESTGVISPDDDSKMDNMTLNTSNASVGLGDRYTGYLALLPTTTSGLLNIDLEVLDGSGNTKTLEYQISASALAGGVRNSINIMVSTLVEDVVISTPGSEFIVHKDYDTYTYGSTESGTITWMLDAANWPTSNSHIEEYGNKYFFVSIDGVCPDPWRIPTSGDLADLSQHLTDNVSVRELFISHRTMPSFYSQGNAHELFIPADDSFVIVCDETKYVADMSIPELTYHRVALDISQYGTAPSDWLLSLTGATYRLNVYPLRCVKTTN